MDDDVTFGTSVWGSVEPSSATVSKPQQQKGNVLASGAGGIEVDDGFDDFDDFSAPVQASDTFVSGDDDDFGDFGDAEEVPAGSDFQFQSEFVQPEAGPSSHAASTSWQPLRLSPPLDREKLEAEVNNILEPLWADLDRLQVTSNEPIREKEGVSQILVTPESQNFYNSLMQSAPPMKPPNWTRSRIRREHLIALGIPVNLDEVLPPHANGRSSLPPLHITTRPMSAPPGSRPFPNGSRTSSPHSSRANSRAPSPTKHSIRAADPQIQFGPKPQIDEAKINALLASDAGSLSLQPLASLERLQRDISLQTGETSALLTYLLQVRDALQQDSETYNGLIAEMVGEAQKKATSRFRNPSRKGSNMV